MSAPTKILFSTTTHATHALSLQLDSQGMALNLAHYWEKFLAPCSISKPPLSPWSVFAWRVSRPIPLSKHLRLRKQGAIYKITICHSRQALERKPDSALP